MTDLVEFLRAQFDEDQAEIEKHPDDPHEVDGYSATRETEYPGLEILTIGKKRALREVEAKRRIIGEILAECEGAGFDHRRGVYGKTLRLLALPYADHPGFKPEWTVSRERA